MGCDARMMNGWSGAMSGWNWAWMIFMLLAVCVLAGVGVVVAVRYLRQRGHAPAIEPSPEPSAEEILADRFARGEIGEDEYWQRVHTLRATERH